jgi:hypothetical protein
VICRNVEGEGERERERREVGICVCVNSPRLFRFSQTHFWAMKCVHKLRGWYCEENPQNGSETKFFGALFSQLEVDDLEEEESAGFAGFLRVLVGGASWGRELVEAKMEAVILLQPVKNLIAREHGTRSWLARKCGTSLRNSSRNMQQQMFGAVGGEQCRFAPLMGGLRRRWQVVVVVRAFSNNSDSRGNNNEDAEAGWESTFEIEVPSDQRPVNELAALKEGALYSWAQLSPVEFAVRIGGLWLLFFLLLGGPIAAGSFEPTRVS